MYSEEKRSKDSAWVPPVARGGDEGCVPQAGR